MEKIERPPAPDWLACKSQAWGQLWKEKLDKGATASNFTWRKYRKKGYAELLESLQAITLMHCSFCDGFPMGARLRCTIEHFKPKVRFPQAYVWDNLFLCCDICQGKKGEAYDEALLKPDHEHYFVDTYFQINWANGCLEPNEAQSDENQGCAEITITMYGLNADGRPNDRKRELKHFLETHQDDINEWAYRFYLSRGSLDESLS